MARPDPSNSPSVVIITSSHWDGDPRLNRHMQYLEAVGHNVDFHSFHGDKRLRALLRATAAVWSTKSRYVILPDPDLFIPGSFLALFLGKRSIVDIHEDYPKVAATRSWIPDIFRPTVSVLARVAIWLGRLMAWRVIVAAPQLAVGSDAVVLNIPNPDSFSVIQNRGSTDLLYIGDVTVPRGVLEMVEILDHLDDWFRLVLVGRIDEKTKSLINSKAKTAGTQDQVLMLGRLPHDVAWKMADEALVGLNLLRDVPAYREAVGTKLWEYMAAGLPPVVSRLPGQTQIVRQVDPDLVVDTPEEAAGIIQEISNDARRRQKLARATRSTVEAEWSSHRPDLVLQEILAP